MKNKAVQSFYGSNDKPVLQFKSNDIVWICKECQKVRLFKYFYLQYDDRK